MRKGMRALVMGVVLSCAWGSFPGPARAEGSESPYLFSFFKSMISSTDGNRCSHRPSCSRYAREAVARHGFLKGAILGCDRLIRCGGDDTERLPFVVVDGKRYAWDPVSANDFWWNKGEEHASLPLHFEGWDR